MFMDQSLHCYWSSTTYRVVTVQTKPFLLWRFVLCSEPSLGKGPQSPAALGLLYWSRALASHPSTQGQAWQEAPGWPAISVFRKIIAMHLLTPSLGNKKSCKTAITVAHEQSLYTKQRLKQKVLVYLKISAIVKMNALYSK